jgi:hypothetical protein
MAKEDIFCPMGHDVFYDDTNGKMDEDIVRLSEKGLPVKEVEILSISALQEMMKEQVAKIFCPHCQKLYLFSECHSDYPGLTGKLN